MALTKKQQRFVLEYLKDQNGTQAAIRAGYSKTRADAQGSRLLGYAEVSKAVDEKLANIADRVGVTVEYILSGLKENAERCLQRKPVMIFDYQEKEMVQKMEETPDGKGGTREEGVWEFDSAGANKAFELLGRYHKMYTDKMEHAGRGGGPMIVETVNYAGPKDTAPV